MSNRTPTRKLAGLLATLAPAALLAACSTTTYDSFRPVRGAKVEIAYVNTEADFSRYQRLSADEMGIYFPTHVTPSEQDTTRVRTAFRESFLSELAGYEIVVEPAPDVLHVRASLVDLRDGKVVWFNLLVAQRGDLREADAANEAIASLLTGLPL